MTRRPGLGQLVRFASYAEVNPAKNRPAAGDGSAAGDGRKKVDLGAVGNVLVDRIGQDLAIYRDRSRLGDVLADAGVTLFEQLDKTAHGWRLYFDFGLARKVA